MSRIKLNNNTYIFSDPHYGQKNIVYGQTTWFQNDDEYRKQIEKALEESVYLSPSDKIKMGAKLDELKRNWRTPEEIEALKRKYCRPFDTVEEHNDVLVENINKTVPRNAKLICLGDWSFGGTDNVKEFRDRINCENIHLIYGNHDTNIENNDSLKLMFKTTQHYLEGSYKTHGQKFLFIFSHYAMRVWRNSHYGSIMLYGHSHNTLDEMTPDIANPTWVGDKYYTKNYRTMDCGVDTHPEFRPYHIDEIVKIMKPREIDMEVDHH